MDSFVSCALRYFGILFFLLGAHCRANYRDWQAPGCRVDQPDLTILQFSDTHVRHGDDGKWLRGELQKAIAEHRPDILVHTGDVTLDGAESEWQAFVEAMKDISVPLEYVWGNHDMPLKKTEFAKGGLTHYRDIGNYRLIFIDTAYDGPFVGSYTSIPESEFAAIRATAETKKKILIFAHHPLAKDAPHFRLRNADAVLALFAGADVIAVITGHFHGAYLANEGKVLYSGVAPLARHQRNHTWSQSKGYRIVELQTGCLKTRHVTVAIP